MNRKHVVLVAAILVVVAIVVAVFFATKSDPVTVVDEPTITAYVDGTPVEGVLKDNEVVIDGKTMDEWKADGYDVVYNRVLNEIEVHVSTTADVDENEVEHNSDNVVDNNGEVVNNEGTGNNQENNDVSDDTNVENTDNNGTTDDAKTEENPVIGEVTDKDDTKTPVEPTDESKDNSSQSENTNKEDKNNGNVGSNETENPNKPVEPEHTHKYTSKVVNPTCVDHGYTLYTCECGHSYESDDFVPPTGHNYKSTKVVAPTTSERGYTIYTCSKCNHSYNDDYVPKLSNDNWIEENLSPDGETIVLDEVSIDIFTGRKETLEGVTEADILAYVNAAAPSDFEGQKVGINRVNAEDPANMLKSEDGLCFDFYVQPEGTLISHSALKKVGTPQENINHFLNTIPTIDTSIRNGGSNDLKNLDGSCGAYVYKDGSYKLSFTSWGNSWHGGGSNVTRSVYLNALSYFGGEKMGVAVWSMLEEHVHYRDARYMISDELAAKYGLKIVDNGKMIPSDFVSGFPFNIRANNISGLKVTDGKQTWTIDYPLYGANAAVRIYIPA